MDGLNVRQTIRIKAHQIKRLEPGTIVLMYDHWSGVTQRFRVVEYGRTVRLQSLDRPNVFIRPMNVVGNTYYIEG